MPEIPSNLIVSMIVGSILFTLAVGILAKSFRIWMGLALWFTTIFVLGRLGFFGLVFVGFIPGIAFGFVCIGLLLRLLYKSSVVQTVFEKIPTHLLIGVQIFRVMGYGFITFFNLGLIPGVFALPTGWGDVLVGSTAIPVAFLLVKYGAKKLAIFWNYLGLADLALALTLGISTYPRPFQIIPTQVDNSLIALFPLVMVPLFAVPVSILLHLFALRKLNRGLDI